MTEVRGKPVEFYDKARFLLEIEGIIYGGFVTASEVGGTSGVIAHYEGGSKKPYKKLGNITYPTLTLERGLSDNTELYEWRKGTEDGTLKGEAKRKTVRLIVQDEDQSDKIAYKLIRCLNSGLVAGPWDNKAEEMVIEKATLEYEDFERENLT
jgi:phage tail-like protein